MNRTKGNSILNIKVLPRINSSRRTPNSEQYNRIYLEITSYSPNLKRKSQDRNLGSLRYNKKPLLLSREALLDCIKVHRQTLNLPKLK